MCDIHVWAHVEVRRQPSEVTLPSTVRSGDQTGVPSFCTSTASTSESSHWPSLSFKIYFTKKFSQPLHFDILIHFMCGHFQ